tara:strand:- start:470 stop:1345 length:876 start_codon:yes stop_codon:yes gene_type:complete
LKIYFCVRREQIYSLVALDIDGTMIGQDRIVSNELKVALNRIQSLGATVSIATGRTLAPSLRVSHESGTNGPVICFQGAMTFDQKSNRPIRHETLGRHQTEVAVSLMSKVVPELMMFLDNDVWVEKRSDWTDGYSQRMGIEIRDSESLLAMSDRRPTAIVGVGDPSIVEPMVADLSDKLDGIALVTHSLPMFCEVEALGAGKDKALEHLASCMKIDSEHVIAVGDGKGDESMIKWAGLGVAVKNGHPDAVSAAQHTIDEPEKFGLVNFLNELADQGHFSADGHKYGVCRDV